MNINDISLVWSPFHDLEFVQVGSSILFYKICNYDISNRKLQFRLKDSNQNDHQFDD